MLNISNCGETVVIAENAAKPKNVKYALIVLILLSLALCSINSEKKDKKSVGPQQNATTGAVANIDTAIVENVPRYNGLTNLQEMQ